MAVAIRVVSWPARSVLFEVKQEIDHDDEREDKIHEVVVEGNLISSRMPPDLPAFCRSIIDALDR